MKTPATKRPFVRVGPRLRNDEPFSRFGQYIILRFPHTAKCGKIFF